jgi:hypothetical protein
LPSWPDPVAGTVGLFECGVRKNAAPGMVAMTLGAPTCPTGASGTVRP